MVELRKISKEELREILAAHRHWLETNEEKGQQADLSNCDLWGMNLQTFYLQRANLHGTHLLGAYLQGTYLQGADLQNAKLLNKLTDIVGKLTEAAAKSGKDDKN